MDINLILNAREEKRKRIEALVDEYQIVSVHANIPGNDKNIKEAYVLVNHFCAIIDSFNYIKKEMIESIDGIYALYYFNNDVSLKEKMIEIEESDRLGRFIDIDVYYKNSVSLNRKTLRKCYICNDSAFVCQRLRKHSLSELISYIKGEVKDYLHALIINTCDISIMAELNLDNKFGLVTPFSNGSHDDMNYNLMVKAKNAILESFFEMFMFGYINDDLHLIFNGIREIGKNAEDKMYSATNGVNAYKGLIFVLGIIVTALGYKISHYTKNDIYEICKIMCKDIVNELKYNSSNETFGSYAYRTYGISGARGEAESGFLHVKMIVNKYNLEDDLLYALIDLISNVDDTVLLKRCGNILEYNKIKEKFKNIKDMKKLNDECISKKYSFGGSADLLVASKFIKEIKKNFKII